jgi:hypothetical protein
MNGFIFSLGVITGDFGEILCIQSKLWHLSVAVFYSPEHLVLLR